MVLGVATPPVAQNPVGRRGDFVANRDELDALNAVSRSLQNPKATLEHATFGLDPALFRKARDAVALRMLARDLDHRPGITVQALASDIKHAAFSILSAEGIGPESSAGKRLLAQAVCDWVRSHVVYNEALEPESLAVSAWKYDVPQAIRQRYWTTKTLLQAPRLFAVCAGYTRLTFDLSRAVGLDTYLVNGFTRFPKNQFSGRRNHSWNVFAIQTDGTVAYIPADNARGRVELSRARSNLRLFDNPFVLPTASSDWGLFLWKQQASELDGGKELQPDALRLSTLTLDEWKGWGSPRTLTSVESRALSENKPATINVRPY